MKGLLKTVLVIGLLVVIAGCGENQRPVDPASLRGWEDRPTLSPAYFVGKQARSYRIAKEIPEIIDSLYCYCECKKHFGHRSLLSCFVDLHASRCQICMDEAIDAYNLYKQGKDVVEIREIIDKRYSR